MAELTAEVADLRELGIRSAEEISLRCWALSAFCRTLFITCSRAGDVSALRDDVRRLQEVAATAEQARSDLSVMCAERVRETERQCGEHVRRMREALQLEREDVLGRLAASLELQSGLQTAVAEEMHVELLRLREELFAARRCETQKEREISFLQRQLDAAKRIAELTYNLPNSDAEHQHETGLL